MLGEVEALNIERATGAPPRTERVAGHLMLTPADDHGRCPYLVLDRCSVYEARPFICRAFGADPALACRHGCEADPPMESEAAKAMLRRIVKL